MRFIYRYQKALIAAGKTHRLHPLRPLMLPRTATPQVDTTIDPASQILTTEHHQPGRPGFGGPGGFGAGPGSGPKGGPFKPGGGFGGPEAREASPRSPGAIPRPKAQAPYGPGPAGPPPSVPSNHPVGAGGQSPPPANTGPIAVSLNGINIPCRDFPDNFIQNPEKLAHFSKPSRFDAVCWSPSSPNTVGPGAPSHPYVVANGGPAKSSSGPDRGFLKTKTGCFIGVTETADYTKKDYQTLLPGCKVVRGAAHWVGTLQEQYSRKDCYASPSLDAKSKDLAGQRVVDLSCFTVGQDVRGNTTWYQNKEEKCYFPGAVFNETGWAGTEGLKCSSFLNPLQWMGGKGKEKARLEGELDEVPLRRRRIHSI
ncbi:hypothetical protein BT63DRAFT_450423 [Microthyrium microscopicum]|uniref:Uncharacterized protein n=1 Tax=Microthyrium microscopicum TaxID=703497 RepID=A0A6A6UVJ9_9PEZI|nr:hypothetical protein BT63DRAFT_450423 [Microthyrium microscopicum]